MTDRAAILGRAPVLALHGVSRRAGAKPLVESVSFEMAAGEVVALLGPSGSGKTTLLRLVAGLDAPSEGRIELYGAVVSAQGRVLLPPERRALGLAFQDATLFPHLDAVGNAAFAIRGVDGAERERRALDALAAMGLEDVRGRDVATLSGGEAQRVSLARALASDARLLLLDEPFGNVDRLTRADLVARLKARLAGVAGAIIITHDAADALELGARVLLRRGGRLVADGLPSDLTAGRAGDWARSFLEACA